MLLVRVGVATKGAVPLPANVTSVPVGMETSLNKIEMDATQKGMVPVLV